ncbi:MAG: hypothetical protein WC390_07255 [Sulfurimonas sp.]|jgi:hypothetical protein
MKTILKQISKIFIIAFLLISFNGFSQFKFSQYPRINTPLNDSCLFLMSYDTAGMGSTAKYVTRSLYWKYLITNLNLKYWSLLGNPGNASYFIGTTDDNDLVFKTNNSNALILKNNKKALFYGNLFGYYSNATLHLTGISSNASIGFGYSFNGIANDTAIAGGGSKLGKLWAGDSGFGFQQATSGSIGSVITWADKYLYNSTTGRHDIAGAVIGSDTIKGAYLKVSVIPTPSNDTSLGKVAVVLNNGKIGTINTYGILNNAWNKKGDAGTNSTTDFVGTTDAQDFYLKANNGRTTIKLNNNSSTVEIDTNTSITGDLHMLGTYSQILFNRGGWIDNPNSFMNFINCNMSVDSGTSFNIHQVSILSHYLDSILMIGNSDSTKQTKIYGIYNNTTAKKGNIHIDSDGRIYRTTDTIPFDTTACHDTLHIRVNEPCSNFTVIADTTIHKGLTDLDSLRILSTPQYANSDTTNNKDLIWDNVSKKIKVRSATESLDWKLAGNTGTTAGTNFIGTTDLQDVVFKTDSIERMRISGDSGCVNITDYKNETIKFPLTISENFSDTIGGTGYVQLALEMKNRTPGATAKWLNTVGTDADGAFCIYKNMWFNNPPNSGGRLHFYNAGAVGGSLIFDSSGNLQYNFVPTFPSGHGLPCFNLKGNGDDMLLSNWRIAGKDIFQNCPVVAGSGLGTVDRLTIGKKSTGDIFWGADATLSNPFTAFGVNGNTYLQLTVGDNDTNSAYMGGAHIRGFGRNGYSSMSGLYLEGYVASTTVNTAPTKIRSWKSNGSTGAAAVAAAEPLVAIQNGTTSVMTINGSGGTVTTGNLTINGPLSGVTNISMNGAVTGATNLVTTGDITSGGALSGTMLIYTDTNVCPSPAIGFSTDYQVGHYKTTAYNKNGTLKYWYVDLWGTSDTLTPSAIPPTVSIKITPTTTTPYYKEVVTFNAVGATTYTWSNAATGSTITVQQTTTTTYTVTGTCGGGTNTATVVLTQCDTCLTASMIAGCDLWLRGDSASITSGKVSTWTDLSGSGNNATQVTAGNRPTQVAGIFNGHSSIRFDGASNTYMTISPLVQAQPYTLFVVHISRYQASSAREMLNGLNNAEPRVEVNWGGASSSIDIWANSAIQYTVANSDYTAINSFIYNTTSSTIYENGTSVATGDIGTDNLTGLTIGVYYDHSAYWYKGDIGFIIKYNRILTTAERQAVEKCLSGYSNIALTY